MDALGNVSFFTLLARWPDEIRLFTVEHEMLEKEDDVIAALDQHPNVALIFRHDNDAPRRDVTEDIAIRLYRHWCKAHDPAREPLPRFIAENIPASFDTGWRNAAE